MGFKEILVKYHQLVFSERDKGERFERLMPNYSHPNDWATEVGNPRYILDLLLSSITVSVKTVDIVNELPRLKFD
jgi:hypothetical protein